MTDWLDNILDRHPGADVPAGLTERVRLEVAAEEPSGKLLNASFGEWTTQLVAAALLLALGFWLGNGRPDVSPIQQDPVDAQVSAAELVQLYENQALFSEWEMAVDESIDLSLSDLAAGTWDPLEDQEPTE